MAGHTFPDVLRSYLKIMLSVFEIVLWLIQSYWITDFYPLCVLIFDIKTASYWGYLEAENKHFKSSKNVLTFLPNHPSLHIYQLKATQITGKCLKREIILKLHMFYYIFSINTCSCTVLHKTNTMLLQTTLLKCILLKLVSLLTCKCFPDMISTFCRCDQNQGVFPTTLSFVSRD